MVLFLATCILEGKLSPLLLFCERRSESSSYLMWFLEEIK